MTWFSGTIPAIVPGMLQVRRRHPAAGFTMVELLIVLLLLGIMATLGFPALLNMIRRSKVETVIKEAAMSARRARLEAVKRSVTTFAQADLTGRRFVVWRDAADDGFTAGTDELVSELALPNGMSFAGPPGDIAPSSGLPAEHYFTFESTGQADVKGGIRIRDDRGNYFEVRVDPAATAKVTLLKWDDVTSSFKTQGEGGKRWTWN
jgi:prepilin-type N-terminal cleavage/methylation domain-containing protein